MLDSSETRSLISILERLLPLQTEKLGLCLLVLDDIDMVGLSRGPRGLEKLRANALAELRARFGTDAVHISSDGPGIVVLVRAPDRDALCAAIEALLLDLPYLPLEIPGETTPRAGGLTARAGAVWLGAPPHTDPAGAYSDLMLALSAGRLSDRTCVVLGDDPCETSDQVRRVAELICDLPAAIAEGRLSLMAQEIVDCCAVTPGRQFEVLLNLRDREGRSHSPADFIAWAERSALIELIDHWVLRSVLVDNAPALAANPDVLLSINVSARSLTNTGFGGSLRALLAEGGVDPRRIQLEVTETSAIRDIGLARRNLDVARELGCRIALDDFGAGLSGYSYLKAFAPHTIKIDGSLIAGACNSDTLDAQIVRSVVTLAKELDIRVVAEHVSSPAILGVIHGLGVDAVQGFLLGRNEPLERILSGDTSRSY